MSSSWLLLAFLQAFVHRHVSQPSRQAVSPGAFPMAAPFVPEALRELSEDAMTLMRLEPSARAKFVEGLQGLGKIVLSNIRTPKVRALLAHLPHPFADRMLFAVTLERLRRA